MRLTDLGLGRGSTHLRPVHQTHRHVDTHNAPLHDLQRAASNQPRALLDRGPLALRVAGINLETVLGTGLSRDHQLIG